MQSLRGQPYQLDEDTEKGYKQALNNNQLNLALHYLTVLLDNLQDTVSSLEQKLESANKEIKKLQKSGSSSKTKSSSKKKKKEEESKSEEE